MLAQPHRLPSTTKLVKSQFLKSPLFGLKYSKNNQSVSRFAFIVRKTVDKRAVVRNRIRRVFRSCIEERIQEISVGYDMLFFLEKGIMDKSRTELCQMLEQKLKERALLQQHQ